MFITYLLIGKDLEMNQEMNREGLSSAEDGENGPMVEFEHIASIQTVDFHANWNDLLQHIWDIAYGKLKEERRPEDKLQTIEGVDVMQYLNMTLRHLRDEKIAKSFKYQIVGPTGGAIQ
jgi:hypothetical protein